MNWITLSNGDDYHLDGGILFPTTYDINTVALSLAQINRFTGHCCRPYSDAEHSLLVADILRSQGHSASVQVAGLMHDGHETLVGDVSSPVKASLGSVWKQFEATHEYRFQLHFGLVEVFHWHREIIRKADLIALATERRDLTTYDPKINKPWAVLDTPGHEILPWQQGPEGTAFRLNTEIRKATTWLDWAWSWKHRLDQLGFVCPTLLGVAA